MRQMPGLLIDLYQWDEENRTVLYRPNNTLTQVLRSSPNERGYRLADCALAPHGVAIGPWSNHPAHTISINS